MGRPLLFKTPKALQDKIDEYFRITPFEDQMITGLAVFLDTSRSTLMDYQGKDDFSYIVKKAKERIEFVAEKKAEKQGRPFDIFRLKQHNWTDKQEIDMNHSGMISLAALAEQRQNPLLESGEEDEL